MFDQIAQAIPTQSIEYLGVKLHIKRLDLVHPQISGNKFFKLKYNLLEAQRLGYENLLTFGGAYSNHIAATAYAAHRFGFKSVGIIRGEELKDRPLNHTLMTAKQLGMTLDFISRENYRLKDDPLYLDNLKIQYPNHYVIPEGGSNTLAIQGCKEILSKSDRDSFDLICCAVGTGSTIAGIIESSGDAQSILGFSALKGDFLKQEIAQWTDRKNWSITDEFCFGGYAKKNETLLEFIQTFENDYSIPLEHIYTAKMLFGIFSMIRDGRITTAQNVLIIHTGGLQGKIA